MAIRYNLKAQQLTRTWRKYQTLFEQKAGGPDTSISEFRDEGLSKLYNQVSQTQKEIANFAKAHPYRPPKWSYLRHSYPKPYHNVVDALKKLNHEKMSSHAAIMERATKEAEANYPKVEKRCDDILAGADLVLEESEFVSNPIPGFPSLIRQLKPLVSFRLLVLRSPIIVVAG
jgi:hypothetical protein